MKKSAFTLLELMIVVIIVGILASLAIPQFTKATEKAKWAGCVQTLGTIRRAVEIYYMEFGDYPPIYTLNVPGEYCPPSLDIGIPEADDEGRYVYTLYPSGSIACAYGFIDKSGNGSWQVGEPYVQIYHDGTFVSGAGAPEF